MIIGAKHLLDFFLVQPISVTLLRWRDQVSPYPTSKRSPDGVPRVVMYAIQLGVAYGNGDVC